ncbi:hypothetical protein RB596_000648 [Gaeumannomyces avenae]
MPSFWSFKALRRSPPLNHKYPSPGSFLLILLVTGRNPTLFSDHPAARPNRPGLLGKMSSLKPGQDTGPAFVGIQGAMLLLSAIAVAARVYTSACLTKIFRFEDGLAVVTLLAFAYLTVVGCIGAAHGMGRHVADVAPDQRVIALFYKYLCMTGYVLVSGLVKFVVGIYLIRLFRNSRQRWQSWTLIALLAMVGIANIFYLFVAIFQCSPIWFFWRRYDPPFADAGSCFKPPMALGSTYTVNIVNIVADLALALMPISLMWNAKLDRRTKFSVVGILALGSASSLVTIIRVPYQKQLLSNPEYLRSFIELGNWSSVEIGLAIIASSAATLRPLFRKFKLLAAEVRSATSQNGRGARPEQGGASGKKPKPGADESFAGTTLQGSALHSRSKSTQFILDTDEKKKVVTRGGALASDGGTLTSFSEYSPKDYSPKDYSHKGYSHKDYSRKINNAIEINTSITVDIEKRAGGAPSPGSGVIVFDPTAVEPETFYRENSQEELRQDQEWQSIDWNAPPGFAAARRALRRLSASKSPAEALADLESAPERRFSIVQPAVDPNGGVGAPRRPSFPRRESSVRATSRTIQLPLMRSPPRTPKAPSLFGRGWPLAEPLSPPALPPLARLSSILSHRSLEEDPER